MYCEVLCDGTSLTSSGRTYANKNDTRPAPADPGHTQSVWISSCGICSGRECDNFHFYTPREMFPDWKRLLVKTLPDHLSQIVQGILSEIDRVSSFMKAEISLNLLGVGVSEDCSE